MNILLCPLSDGGYLYPAIAVGRELRSRRHDVQVLLRPETAPSVACCGLDLLPAEYYGERGTLSAVRWHERTQQQYRAVRRAAADGRADCLVTSVLCPGALLAAEVLDLPVVVLGFAAYLWEYVNGAAGEPELPVERAGRSRQLIGLYQQAREQAGRPRRRFSAADNPLAGTALLLRGDPVLEYPGGVLPHRVQHVGPCAWEPAADPAALSDITTRLDQCGKPVVYVHLGRVFGGFTLWPWLNAAFTGGRFQAVVEQGRSRDPQPDPAADITLVRKPWMGPLLDQAGLVLSNGTSAPVLNALLRGLPLAVAPNGSEQPLLSRACVRAGVAVYAGERAGADAPATVLRRAWQEPGVRHRAQQLGHRLAASGSARRAADIVEAAAGGVRHGTGAALADVG